MIGPCVIDASVGIKLFVREQGTDIAEIVFSGLTEEPPIQLYVPDLFYVECANILWKYVRRFNYASDVAQSDLSDLMQLNLDTVATENLLIVALGMAVEYSLSVYDACYVALASLLELPLLTADERLINKMLGKPYDIRLLGDLEPPAT